MRKAESRSSRAIRKSLERQRCLWPPRPGSALRRMPAWMNRLVSGTEDHGGGCTRRAGRRTMVDAMLKRGWCGERVRKAQLSSRLESQLENQKVHPAMVVPFPCRQPVLDTQRSRCRRGPPRQAASRPPGPGTPPRRRHRPAPGPHYEPGPALPGMRQAFAARPECCLWERTPRNQCRDRAGSAPPRTPEASPRAISPPRRRPAPVGTLRGRLVVGIRQLGF